MKTEVIIVGAGPTGLMAACQLQRFGIEFIIVDVKSQPTKESKATILTARSLEIYQQMGLYEKMKQQGITVKALSIYVNGKKKTDFIIGDAGVGLTDFPHTFSFEQSANEELLYQTLQREVLWNTSFVSLQQENDRVIVRLKNHNDQKEDLIVEASYLIACDGARSSVRKFLGCPFEGKTYENKFFVTDTKINWDLPYNKLITVPTKAGLCTFFPMKKERNYRISGTLPKSYHHQEKISFEDLQEVVRSTTKLSVNIEEVNWFSTYRLHYRAVDNFRIGRCFLAGDAARIHSPAVGQGMNNGLQEAYNLSWKLAMVIREHAGNQLLDSYHSERYPFARWAMKYSNRVFELTTSNNKVISFFRLHVIPLVMKLAPKKLLTGTKTFKKTSQLWYNYRKSTLSVHKSNQKLSFKAGDRFPYVMVNLDNELQSCYHLLTAAKFHLVIITDYNAFMPSTLLSDQFESLVKTIVLPLSEAWKNLGVTDTLYILVRPDNYIAMLSDSLQQDTLENYFINCLFKNTR